MTSKIPAFLVFGPQGSGKTTQAQRLAEHFSLPFFDAGVALREIAQSQSELGQRIQTIMSEGKLVSNAVLEDVIMAFVAEHQTDHGIVMDGFPRNATQSELLTSLAAAHHWEIIGIFITISDETAKKRLSERFEIKNGQKTVRHDDQPAIVEKRLRVFRQETLPVIEWLRNHYQLIEIDGEPDRETVTETIISAVHRNGFFKAH